jgi:hypothetical protein
MCQAPVAQEDCGSEPAQANSPRDPISKKKKNHKKRAHGVAQGVGSEFKPECHQKKKNTILWERWRQV